MKAFLIVLLASILAAPAVAQMGGGGARGTVTNTLGPLTAGFVITGNGANDEAPSVMWMDGTGKANAPGGFASVGTASGTLFLSGLTSGTFSQTVQAAAGTWTFTWPIAQAAAHQWLTTDMSGNASFTQPAFTDISGSLASSQMPALTGDVTSTAGTVATTVKGINGALLSGLATGILKNTTTTGVPSIAVAGTDYVVPAGSISGNAGTATALAAAPTLCTTGNAPTGILANGNATGCASISSSGMANPMTTLGDIIYENGTPAAARLAGNTTSVMYLLSQTGTGTVSAAPVWITTTGAGAYIPTVSAASTFSTTASAVYTFPSTTATLAALGTGQTWTAMQSFNAGDVAVNSGIAGALRIVPGAAYTGSTDGTLNRTSAPSHGFGASSTPSIQEVYEPNGGAGTGGKLAVLPGYFSSGGSLTNTAVSSFNLAVAPGSTVGQMWEVSGTIVFTGTITCTAGTFAATVTWTDGRGSNSYSPVSVAYGSLSSAAASGTTLGGQYNFSFQFIQRSSAAPTFSTTLPTCTALPYDWFVSARRIG